MISSLKGGLECSVRDIFAEKCGLGGAVNIPNASQVVQDIMLLQEARGEKSAGIVSSDGDRFHSRHRMGRPSIEFGSYDACASLPGLLAIEQNRYATTGSAFDMKNMQPIIAMRSKWGMFALGHNGNLEGLSELERSLTDSGAVFQTTTDSEIFMPLICKQNTSDIVEAVAKACNIVGAAYSLLIMTPQELIAVRDRHGVRPLSIASYRGGHIVVSESYVIDQFKGAKFIRDVNPGELVVFRMGEKGFESVQYHEPKEAWCIFEGIYFSNPRSRYKGIFHEDFRQMQGERIYLENKQILDRLNKPLVVPILDSGKHAALGFSKASGFPYSEAFLRIHNPPRTSNRSFTSPTKEDRETSAYKKQHLRDDLIRGNTIITIDDSIVRSTTTLSINTRMREAEAGYVLNVIASPPIIDICPYGMDFQNKAELIAAHSSIEEIRKSIGSDKLIYLTLNGLQDIVSQSYKAGICSGCFGGRYASSI